MTTFAVFDLDGTITRGDTFVAYSRYMLQRRPWRLIYCLPMVWFAAMLALNRIDRDEAKWRLLAAVAGGVDRAALARMAEDFIGSRVQQMVKPAALRRIQDHAARGDVLIMATASLDIYAERLGERLGFAHVLASRAAWRKDRITRGLDGPNLKEGAKQAALAALLAALGDGKRHIVAYSDHHSDLPLLQYADEAVAIDPTHRLAEAAVRLGIPIERWSR